MFPGFLFVIAFCMYLLDWPHWYYPAVVAIAVTVCQIYDTCWQVERLAHALLERAEARRAETQR